MSAAVALPLAASWHAICALEDILPESGAAALVDGKEVAVFRVRDAVFAIGNHDPASGANVLSRGIVGDIGGEIVVASPIYKHHFSLITGRCLEEPRFAVPAYMAEVRDGLIWVGTKPAMKVRTTCPYCGVGCGVLARAVDGGAEVGGDPEHPANRGALCSKGSALGDTVGLQGRLLHPQVRGVDVA